MKYEIRSSEVCVVLSSEGAQLNSLIKNSTEYLWQGDEQFWKGQAPVCFPICGVLKENAEAFGEALNMKRHGVARISPFGVKEHCKNSITFVQNSSDETKSAFPFDYCLEIKYTVNGSTLTTEYTVKNTGEKILPFSIGGHPAFNCPLSDDESFEDYKVVFDKKINKMCLRPDIHTGYINGEKRYSVIDGNGEIPMKHSLFYDDAMVFDGIEAKSATLMGKSGRGVRVDYEEFENLLVWSSANNGNFVALEPWNGITVFDDEENVPFEKKRCVKILEPECVYSCRFKITLL